MFKATCVTTLLAAGLMSTACTNDSRSMADGRTNRSSESVRDAARETGRIDPNGNRLYDLGPSDNARVGDSNGVRGEDPGDRSATDRATAESKRFKDGTTYATADSVNRNADGTSRDGMSDYDRNELNRRDSRNTQDYRSDQDYRDSQNSSTYRDTRYGQSGQNEQPGQYDQNGQTRNDVSTNRSGKTSQTIRVDQSSTDPLKTDQSKTDQARMDQARRDQARMDQSRMDQSRMDQSKTDQSRTEQSRRDLSTTEQFRPEQSRTEQSRTEQSWTGQSKTGQSRTDQSNTEQSRTAQSRNSQDGQNRWNDQNGRQMRRDRDANSGQNPSNLASWGGRSWDNDSVTVTTEAEMPAAVRAGISREANGTALSETGRGTWNGKPAYCARITRGNFSYKVVTDENGDLIAMNRID